MWGGHFTYVRWTFYICEVDILHMCGGYFTYVRWTFYICEVDILHMWGGHFTYVRWTFYICEVDILHMWGGHFTYVRWKFYICEVDILLTRGKHLHDHIMSLEGKFNPPFCIEVSVPNHDIERSCICVWGISMLPLSTNFLFYFGTIPTVWYFFLFFSFSYLTFTSVVPEMKTFCFEVIWRLVNISLIFD
jgi:hypothetical protein